MNDVYYIYESTELDGEYDLYGSCTDPFAATEQARKLNGYVRDAQGRLIADFTRLGVS